MQIDHRSYELLKEIKEVRVDGYGQVMTLKEEVPSQFPEIQSIRDFGGCYLVHGRYLLRASEVLKCNFLSMVDVSITKEFANAAELARKTGVEVEVLRGDFRNPDLYKDFTSTDASFLYEVLLHQDNYMEVIRQVTICTKKYIFIAQPCLKENYFNFPGGSVLLQFYESSLKEMLKMNSFWPEDEPEFDRFDPRVWMWGHTISHLLFALHGYGWRLKTGLKIPNVAGTHFDYAILAFSSPEAT
jgi:hypothetical protein